jgi:hypothetical protein
MIELEMFNLIFLNNIVADMALVLKIFTFLAIIGFVKNHLGINIISLILILGLAWLILLDNFLLFGGFYILYVLFGLGFTGIIIDFIFIKPQPGQGQQSGGIGSGKDYMDRQAQLQKLMRG